ncbi:MAG: hypothetical protein VKJ04_07740 [Vampirovibrionales bacterium]|nr:hypothetical protein [Vampirovibrionales bacterium]
MSIFAENPIARADRTLYRQSVVAITVPAPKNPFAKFQLGLVSRAIEDGENVGIVGGSEDGTLTILTGRALNKAARNQNRARDDEFYKTGH